MEIKEIEVINTTPGMNGKMITTSEGQDLFLQKGFIYLEIKVGEEVLSITCPAEGELKHSGETFLFYRSENKLLKITV